MCYMRNTPLFLIALFCITEGQKAILGMVPHGIFCDKLTVTFMIIHEMVWHVGDF